MTASPTQPLAKTSNVHVGPTRFDAVTKIAIEISQKAGKQIGASKLMQFLSDNYMSFAGLEMASRGQEQSFKAKKAQATDKASTLHVGFERYTALSKVAIEVSYKTGVQISASHVAQYLVDNYLEAALPAITQHYVPSTEGAS